MTSEISDTDLKYFASLVNPSKARLNMLQHDMHTNTRRPSHNSGDSEMVKCNSGSEAGQEDSADESSAGESSAGGSSASGSSASGGGSSASGGGSSASGGGSSSGGGGRKAGRESLSGTAKRSDVLRAGGFDDLLRHPGAGKRRGTTSSRASDASSVASSGRQQPFGDFIKKRATSDVLPRDDGCVLQKQNVLMDMERLRLQGIQFSKNWTLEDRLEDMQFEMRRHMLNVEEMNNINMMRDGMRMICTGVEMVNGRFNLLELNGWASEVCGDMQKYDTSLSKLYRKYWRRSTSASPEMDIAMGLITSMGMFHFKKKLSSKMFSPAQPQRPTAPPSSPHASSRNRGRNQRGAPPPLSDTESEGMPP